MTAIQHRRKPQLGRTGIVGTDPLAGTVALAGLMPGWRQSLRQRPSFQSNPPGVMGWIRQHRKQIFRLAFHLYFPKLTSGPLWSLMFRAAVLRTVIWARHIETCHIKVTVGDKDSVAIGGRVGGDFVP